MEVLYVGILNNSWFVCFYRTCCS